MTFAEILDLIATVENSPAEQAAYERFHGFVDRNPPNHARSVHGRAVPWRLPHPGPKTEVSSDDAVTC
jgi:hypothetical protein